MKFNAKQLRAFQSSEPTDVKTGKNNIYIILDNVLDTYNIGSVFRLADAASIKKIYLCGGTETPPNHRIKKASINTTEWVKWEYFDSAVEAIQALRQEVPDIQVVSIELAEGSVPYTEFDFKLPVALVVGHESEGVLKETMEASDAIVELPMHGVNISLNVMVSLGIVLYKVLEKVK